MQLRRTAATAAIAALGGLAVLGTAPAATAATPSAQPCKTGLVGVSISGLGGSVLNQGGSAVAGTVTLVNKTGHDLPDFLAAILLGPDSASKPTGGITVSQKSGGSWHTLSYVKGLPGYIFLTGVKAPVDLPAGGKLTYTLRFQAPSKAEIGPYHALALGEDVKSVVGGATAITPEVAQSLQNQAANAVSGNSATSATTNCTKDWGFAAVPFSVAAGGSSTKPTPAPSASSKPSTEPVSSVSTSPAASASPTGAVLAKTGGGNATLPVAVGGALVVLGAGAVVMTRRRKAARH
jgi:LPXTG-motif cell wall-anchored protein